MCIRLLKESKYFTKKRLFNVYKSMALSLTNRTQQLLSAFISFIYQINSPAAAMVRLSITVVDVAFVSGITRCIYL